MVRIVCDLGRKWQDAIGGETGLRALFEVLSLRRERGWRKGWGSPLFGRERRLW